MRRGHPWTGSAGRAPITVGWARWLAIGVVLLGGLDARSTTAQAPEHPDGHVHDWLVWWPRCAQERAEPPRVGVPSLLYPRPGLPAVVRPGHRLTLRVRLAAPLTPPPGIQQEKALRGWAASLVGRPTWRWPGAEHRYPLRVADVRPDGRQTPVFRASVDLPPWIAPGTYDLVLRVPGGEVLASVASVRVADRSPVLAHLPDDIRGIGDLDVDVWVARGPVPDLLRRPLRGEGVPWLDTESGAILAVGAEAIWDGARCEDLLAPSDPARASLGERAAVTVAEVQGRVRVEGLSAAVVGAATLGVVVPEGWSVRAPGARLLGAWPATPVRAAGLMPSVRVALAVEDTRVSVEAVPATPLEVRLALPSRARSGQPVSAALEGEAAALALSWEEDGAGFGAAGTSIPVELRWMEVSEVHGLALASDGRSARVAATIRGAPRRPGGCSAGSDGSQRDAPGNWWLLACLGTLGGARYTSARVRSLSRRE